MDKNKPSQSVPDEINTHLEIFGKESWDMNYDQFGYCQFCNSNRRTRLLCLWRICRIVN